MDLTAMRSSSLSGNIRVTAVEDDATQAKGTGGITFLDYGRVHVVRPGQGRASSSSSSLSGVGTVVQVEDVAMGDDRRALEEGHSAARVREVAQQAAEVCRTVRQICVQNGNTGAERAARDAMALIDQIVATNFQKS